MLKDDPLHRVLFIDLTRKRFWVEDRRELFEKYIGGTGVAIKLLEELCPKNADPLGPENPIIFAVGPLNGAFPLASKTVAMFKSPLTGNLGESHAGGRSATSIRLAGYGAIVITGASKSPVYVVVYEDKVFFRDASVLWGMSSSKTPRHVVAQREPGSGFRTVMGIGRAGENLVRYACVVTETYRHFGRLGLGAVFGSKKLKVLEIAGKHSLPIKDRRRYIITFKKIHQLAVKSTLMKKYHDIGTASNVLPLNTIKALPTMNLQKSFCEGAEFISGEYFAKHFLGRRIACSLCPVGCVHLAALREPYEDEPYFFKTTMISYDYELIYALGSMLNVTDAEGLLRLLDVVEVAGLDAMSTGVALAWATEAFSRGLIDERTVGFRLKWGDVDTYIRAIWAIVDQKNDFFKALAKGTAYTSKIYGGSDFALVFGGNEMPGYHTGPTVHVAYMFGTRHSHLDSAGYSFDQKKLKEGNMPTPSEIAEYIYNEESWRQILTSLVICLFARKIYSPEIILDSLSVFGIEMSENELRRLGEEIYINKYKFKIREGFNLDNLSYPKRIFETPSPFGRIPEEVIRSASSLLKQKILNKIK